jgi:hypothetical protein
MKRVIKPLMISVAASCFNPLYAADSSGKEWAASIGTGGVSIRNSISSNSDLFFGARFYYSKYDNGPVSSSDHYLGFDAGYRNYLDKSDIRKFIEGSLSYTHMGVQYYPHDQESIRLMYGLESFVSADFSIEGSAGIGFYYYNGDDHYADTYRVSVPIIKLAVNYYF